MFVTKHVRTCHCGDLCFLVYQYPCLQKLQAQTFGIEVGKNLEVALFISISKLIMLQDLKGTKQTIILILQFIEVSEFSYVYG